MLNKNYRLCKVEQKFKCFTGTQNVKKPKAKRDFEYYILYKEINKGLGSDDFCLAIFIDLGKEFDCPSHEILLSKLDFDFNCCLFIESYLSSRQ